MTPTTRVPLPPNVAAQLQTLSQVRARLEHSGDAIGQAFRARRSEEGKRLTAQRANDVAINGRLREQVLAACKGADLGLTKAVVQHLDEAAPDEADPVLRKTLYEAAVRAAGAPAHVQTHPRLLALHRGPLAARDLRYVDRSVPPPPAGSVEAAVAQALRPEPRAPGHAEAERFLYLVRNPERLRRIEALVPDDRRLALAAEGLEALRLAPAGQLASATGADALRIAVFGVLARALPGRFSEPWLRVLAERLGTTPAGPRSAAEAFQMLCWRLTRAASAPGFHGAMWAARALGELLVCAQQHAELAGPALARAASLLDRIEAGISAEGGRRYYHRSLVGAVVPLLAHPDDAIRRRAETWYDAVVGLLDGQPYGHVLEWDLASLLTALPGAPTERIARVFDRVPDSPAVWIALADLGLESDDRRWATALTDVADRIRRYLTHGLRVPSVANNLADAHWRLARWLATPAPSAPLDRQLSWPWLLALRDEPSGADWGAWESLPDWACLRRVGTELRGLALANDTGAAASRLYQTLLRLADRPTLSAAVRPTARLLAWAYAPEGRPSIADAPEAGHAAMVELTGLPPDWLLTPDPVTAACRLWAMSAIAQALACLKARAGDERSESSSDMAGYHRDALLERFMGWVIRQLQELNSVSAGVRGVDVTDVAKALLKEVLRPILDDHPGLAGRHLDLYDRERAGLLAPLLVMHAHGALDPKQYGDFLDYLLEGIALRGDETRRRSWAVRLMGWWLERDGDPRVLDRLAGRTPSADMEGLVSVVARLCSAPGLETVAAVAVLLDEWRPQPPVQDVPLAAAAAAWGRLRDLQEALSGSPQTASAIIRVSLPREDDADAVRYGMGLGALVPVERLLVSPVLYARAPTGPDAVATRLREVEDLIRGLAGATVRLSSAGPAHAALCALHTVLVDKAAARASGLQTTLKQDRHRWDRLLEGVAPGRREGLVTLAAPEWSLCAPPPSVASDAGISVALSAVSAWAQALEKRAGAAGWSDLMADWRQIHAEVRAVEVPANAASAHAPDAEAHDPWERWILAQPVEVGVQEARKLARIGDLLDEASARMAEAVGPDLWAPLDAPVRSYVTFLQAPYQRVAPLIDAPTPMRAHQELQGDGQPDLDNAPSFPAVLSARLSYEVLLRAFAHVEATRLASCRTGAHRRVRRWITVVSSTGMQCALLLTTLVALAAWETLGGLPDPWSGLIRTLTLSAPLGAVLVPLALLPGLFGGRGVLPLHASRLGLPRMWAANMLGVSVLPMTDEAWGNTLNAGSLELHAGLAILAVLGFAYLFWEIEQTGLGGEGRWGKVRRTLRVWSTAMNQCLLLTTGVSLLIMRAVTARLNPKVPVPPRLFGLFPATIEFTPTLHLPVAPLIVLSVGAMFLGLLLQVLWEPRPLSDGLE